MGMSERPPTDDSGYTSKERNTDQEAVSELPAFLLMYLIFYENSFSLMSVTAKFTEIFQSPRLFYTKNFMFLVVFSFCYIEVQFSATIQVNHFETLSKEDNFSPS